MTADEYRKHAQDMIACAQRATTADERAEYLKMAKAWAALAEGAEKGLEPEASCDEPEA